jgi:hypothetical protein
MTRIEPRDLLCWNSRTQAHADWEPSPENRSWRPTLDHYPDTRVLAPGDILLFQPLNPSLRQRVSQKFQGSPFTHAAIYVGFDHEICEAIPGDGVIHSSFEDSITDCCVLVRRVPNLNDDDRNRIAIEAGRLRGQAYAFREIFQLAAARYLKLNTTLSDAERHAVICSTLCEHAILVVTKGALCLRRDINDVITPARLAETPQLEDVAVTWTCVPDQR